MDQAYAWVTMQKFAWMLPALSLAAFIAGNLPAQNRPDQQEWTPLFNGKDLAGWAVKITGHDLDDNFGTTFRVEGGVLKVVYDQYDKFAAQFGHIFYREKFSHYLLVVEYRFVGEQCAGGPNWARRNSGVMLHSQSPESMGTDQDFPISIEVQFLGGLGSGERSTANLCTPGTHVVMDGKLVTQHCVNSSSRAPGRSVGPGGSTGPG